MRTKTLFPALAFLAGAAAGPAATHAAGEKPFLGKWDINPVAPKGAFAYWLEVKQDGDKLSGAFLNRGGSVGPLELVKVENNELLLWTKGKQPPDSASPFGRGKIVKGKLEITFTGGKFGETKCLGERPPMWKKADANAKQKYGKPVTLFDGKSLDGWGFQDPDKPGGWVIVNGTLTNEAHANNLVSKVTFKNFKAEAEYNIDKGSNSGFYVRGRYELQILDDAGKPAEALGHMAIYSRLPPSINASKAAGEWQTMEAIVVGNKVTVTLNGQKVHDNATLEGITGGAMDAREGEPGPILIQGDHGKVSFRKIVVTPILGN